MPVTLTTATVLSLREPDEMAGPAVNTQWYGGQVVLIQNVASL